MTCTTTINGVAVEVKGSAVECFEFMRLMFPAKPAKKICDPMSRHIGNCGAEDCPIIPGTETYGVKQGLYGIHKHICALCGERW